jgi:Phage integrase family
MKMTTRTRRVGDVTVVDISGRLEIGAESAALRDFDFLMQLRPSKRFTRKASITSGQENRRPKSAVGDYQRALRTLFDNAGTPRAHAHLFRHTFATELLTAGNSLETVAALLGHGSTKITERSYSHWVKGRQEKLEEAVKKTMGTIGHSQGYGVVRNVKKPTKTRQNRWWRRGELNPRPKSATPRSLHAYLSSFGSPAALGTSKKRRRLVRWFSPEPYGPKGSGQLTVRRLDPGP